MLWAQWVYLFLGVYGCLYQLYQSFYFNQHVEYSAQQMRSAYARMLFFAAIAFVLSVFAGSYDKIFGFPQ